MPCRHEYVLAAALLLAVSSLATAQQYALGRTASEKEIAGWDIDVAPDGAGLPPGQGTVAEGRDVYAQQCAACHGEKGLGDPMNRLVTGKGTLDTDSPARTVGSYWPYATTLYDYVYRTMPFNAPQSLTPDQVYAVSAHVLYLNGIVEQDAVMNADTLPAVRMPNRDGFYYPDPRPDVRNVPCMQDCGE